MAPGRAAVSSQFTKYRTPGRPALSSAHRRVLQAPYVGSSWGRGERTRSELRAGWALSPSKEPLWLSPTRDTRCQEQPGKVSMLLQHAAALRRLLAGSPSIQEVAGGAGGGAGGERRAGKRREARLSGAEPPGTGAAGRCICTTAFKPLSLRAGHHDYSYFTDVRL